MSLKNMLECIVKNNLECLKTIMEDDDTFLTNKICTQLLVKSLENKRSNISNYILQYVFDLDSEIFENFLERNRPFNEKQIENLNRILNKFYICCMVNT
jgi:chaperonin GroEL (HSP60 family)